MPVNEQHLLNRAKSSPLWAFMFMGLWTPLFSIYYAIRQNNWMLTLYPLLATFVWSISPHPTPGLLALWQAFGAGMSAYVMYAKKKEARATLGLPEDYTVL